MKSPAPGFGLTASLVFLAAAAASSGAQEKGGFRPALIGNGPKALVNLIDTNKLTRDGQRDAVVMFDAAIIDDHGGEAASFWCRGSAGSERLENEVKKELQSAVFIPALAHGRAVGVYFRGTVVFAVQDGRPRLQVFANQDRAELARGSDYIEPQMILGTDDWQEAKAYLGVLTHHWRRGTAVVRVTVDAEGKRQAMALLKEEPKGLNVGAAALKTLSTAQFIPAFRDGHPVATTFEMLDYMYGYRYRR